MEIQHKLILKIRKTKQPRVFIEPFSLLKKLRTAGSALKSKLLNRPGRPYQSILELHEGMLSGNLTAPLRSTVYALQLWYGVRRLDPTHDLDLAIFCRKVPQWIYRQGKKPLEQRLLAREGLRHLLPELISQNPYRGEQGADWYLHYNFHCKYWKQQLIELPPIAQKILWQSYDQQKIFSLFENYPYFDQAPNRRETNEISHQLLRCLSMSWYLAGI